MASQTSDKNEKVGIIGSGLVGSSFAMLFAAAGYRVTLYDIEQSQLDKALTNIRSQLQELSKSGLLRGTAGADDQAALMTTTTDLATCFQGAVYIQECVPEVLELKRKVWLEIDAHAQDSMVLASSTSCIPCSQFTSELKHRTQCLVTHPVNPPYYCPLVEVIPAPYTKPEVTQRAIELMKIIGQSPIHVRKEIPGFVLNRIQYAMMNECYRLVQDDVISVEDVDKVLKDGLGMRYAFMGPMETIHLNAEGVADYCDRYAEGIRNVSADFGPVPRWEGATVDRMAADMATSVPLDQLAQRRQWRDSRLAQLALLKRKMDAADK